MAVHQQHKTSLRQDLLAQRQAIPLALRKEWNAAISKHLHHLLQRQPARIIGVFWPMRSEPDLRQLFEEWSAAGVKLALPVVIDPVLPLKFLDWMPGDPLMKDAMGVWIPSKACAELEPDLLLVPCVGYNHDKYRLGYGGGFYDRTLATSPRPRAIGVAYSCSRAEFAVEGHDIPLDAVVTEAGIEN